MLPIPLSLPAGSKRRAVIKIAFSIRWKLILSIIVPLLFIASVVMGLTLQRIYDSAVSTLQLQRLNEVRLLARSINFELISIARVAEDTAAFVGIQPTLESTELYNLLHESASSNPLVYGAALAFEPFAFNSSIRLFAPYVFDTDYKAIDISTLTGDYTSEKNFWYTQVHDSGNPQWSEPYFDTGAGSMPITTYSTPVSRNSTLLGVATVDLRLDELSREIAAQLDNDYFMIMSPSGRFISHYDNALTLNSTLQEQASNPEDVDLQLAVEDILRGNSGLKVLADQIIDGELAEGNTWIVYTPIPSTGWTLATLQSQSELTAPLREQISIALAGLTLTIMLIFVLVWWTSSRLSRPIKRLEAAVSDVARGKLDTHIENIQSLDELGRLSIGFNRMLKNLKKQIELQSQQEANQKMLEREWQMARETQRSLLPTTFPPFPDRKEFDLHAVNQAAHHVAGDYFDFFLANPKTLIFVIADVSGKGMSAALVMAVTRTIVRSLAHSGKSPADILRETNDQLRESQKGVAFVTLFLGAYNISNGRIIYANGGHNPGLIVARNGTVTTVGEATGTIVGMLEHQEYRNAEFRLQPGETLLLFTDGFPEARSPSGEFYGQQRIKSFLELQKQSPASVICETAIRNINQFQHNQLADDITILALKRHNTGISSFLNNMVKPKAREQ